MSSEETEEKKEDELVEGVKQAVAISLNRMSSNPDESLSYVEEDLPAFASAIIGFEKRVNFLRVKKDENLLYPRDWSMSETVNELLLISRSRKGKRGNQITEICKEGVKSVRGARRLFGGLIGDDDDDYRKST